MIKIMIAIQNLSSSHIKSISIFSKRHGKAMTARKFNLGQHWTTGHFDFSYFDFFSSFSLYKYKTSITRFYSRYEFSKYLLIFNLLNINAVCVINMDSCVGYWHIYILDVCCMLYVDGRVIKSKYYLNMLSRKYNNPNKYWLRIYRESIVHDHKWWFNSILLIFRFEFGMRCVAIKIEIW